MPSAKFTESEVLEPSESFREREKISEVEADLRAYFAWEIGKPLPGWIYDKLKKYPLLTEHTIKFLHWLRSQPATNKCKAKTCSLYDIMVDCMITDLLMSALQRFETQYRLNEYNARPTLQASDSTAPAIKSASYFRWLYPENPTRHLKLSNLKREPLSRYYYASDGSFLPCTLDTEFLQVITSMHSCTLQKPDDQYILQPLCFLPFMCDHPYFIYSVEKHFGYYQMHTPRNEHAISSFNELLSAVQHHYRYFPELVQKNIREARDPKRCGFKFMARARSSVRALTDITNMLTEWVQLFSSQYYTFSRKTDIYDRSIIDRLTVALEHHDDCADITVKSTPWKKHSDKKKTIEIPPVDVDNLFFSLFAEPKHVENPQGLFLEQFRELVNSSELERRLSYSLNENADLTPYIDALCQTLNAARSSRDYTNVYALLSALFSDSKSLKPVSPQIPLTPLKDLNALTAKCERKITEDQAAVQILCDDEQIVAQYKEALHRLVYQLLTISQDHQSSENKAAFGSAKPFWFEREDEWDKASLKYLLFEPDDYITMPCTKMFFTRVHRELWPAAFADPEESACCITHYFIGACVTAHMLEQLQTLIPAIEPQDAHYIADETDTTEEDLLLWRWARKFFQTDELPSRHSNLKDSDPQLLALNAAGKGFPLLRRVVQWFYPLSALKQLMKSELLEYESELELPGEDVYNAQPCLCLLYSAENEFPDDSPLQTLLDQLINSSGICWTAFMKNPDAYPETFFFARTDQAISLARKQAFPSEENQPEISK